MLGVQEVPSSNLGGPTKFFKDFQRPALTSDVIWSPTGVQTWDTGASLSAPAKNTAPNRGTSLILEKPDIPDILALSN